MNSNFVCGFTHQNIVQLSDSLIVIASTNKLLDTNKADASPFWDSTAWCKLLLLLFCLACGLLFVRFLYGFMLVYLAGSTLLCGGNLFKCTATASRRL